MGETKDVRSDFLFAVPSVWSGVARLLDLFGKFDFYNVSQTPEQADARAIYSDWRIVGQDLRDATNRYKREHLPRQGNLFEPYQSANG